jgi:hypothetical protein
VTVSDTFDHLPEYSGSMSADAIPEVSVTSSGDKPAGQELSSPNLPHRKVRVPPVSLWPIGRTHQWR